MLNVKRVWKICLAQRAHCRVWVECSYGNSKVISSSGIGESYEFLAMKATQIVKQWRKLNYFSKTHVRYEPAGNFHGRSPDFNDLKTFQDPLFVKLARDEMYFHKKTITLFSKHLKQYSAFSTIFKDLGTSWPHKRPHFPLLLLFLKLNSSPLALG